MRPVSVRVIVHMVCAWCPNFDPTDASNRGASHGICADCLARLDAELSTPDRPGPDPA